MDRRKVVYGVIGVLVAGKVMYWAYNTTRTALMLRRARKRCAEIRSKKPALPAVSPEVRARVLSLTASELVQEMKAGRLLCVEVMATYIERACTIGHDHNLTAEEVFEEALSAAIAADKQRSEHPDSLGPLFGLPVSIKDHINQKGCSSSGGVIHKSHRIHDKDSHIVAIIRASGGIPFVRSNVPQTMLWVETESHLYGRAENPWDRSRTTGGSSGGEAGLVAARCSPLGIGSDIGGSIRNPAASCGVYGFKPSPQRVRFDGISFAHIHDYCSASHIVPPASGPIGQSTEDLAMLLRTWWQPSTFQQDPFLMPLAFNDATFQAFSSGKRLRIGYHTNLEGLPESASCMTRIVDQARASLEAQGHELVEFNMPDVHGMGKRYYQVLMTVGPREVEECLMGEPPVWFNAPVLDIGESRLMLKFSLLMLRMLGYERMAGLLDYKVAVNSKAYMELFQNFNDYTLAVTKAWTDLKLDACIGPSMGLPAFPHRGSELMTPFLCYQILINSLQYPAGVVPVGRVLPGEDNYDSKVEDALTRNARKVMKGAVGLPLAIQVIALPYEDEKALAVMKLLEGIFNFHEHPL